jgi:hypothetical protein
MFLLTIHSIPILRLFIADVFTLARELCTRAGVGCECGGCGVTGFAGHVFLLWMGRVREFAASSFVALSTLLGEISDDCVCEGWWKRDECECALCVIVWFHRGLTASG